MKPRFTILIFAIVIIILAFSLFLSYIVYWDTDVHNKEGFEDRPRVEDVQSSRCENADLKYICANNKSCCAISNYSYFCKHPLVANCSTELQNCLDKTDFDALYPIELRKEKCKNQLADCCNPFDKVPYDQTKFENMGKLNQTADVLGNYLALEEKQREVCPKLCQTDSKCAAYSMDRSGCKFYSSVNPIISKFGNSMIVSKVEKDETGKTGYFRKL
jgi:hypothetical protein